MSKRIFFDIFLVFLLESANGPLHFSKCKGLHAGTDGGVLHNPTPPCDFTRGIKERPTARVRCARQQVLTVCFVRLVGPLALCECTCRGVLGEHLVTNCAFLQNRTDTHSRKQWPRLLHIRVLRKPTHRRAVPERVHRTDATTSRECANILTMPC